MDDTYGSRYRKSLGEKVRREVRAAVIATNADSSRPGPNQNRSFRI